MENPGRLRRVPFPSSFLFGQPDFLFYLDNCFLSLYTVNNNDFWKTLLQGAAGSDDSR